MKDIETGTLQGFVRIRYFDEDIQVKVQGMKHVIKEQEVEVEFLQVCGILNIIVWLHDGSQILISHTHTHAYMHVVALSVRKLHEQVV